MLHMSTKLAFLPDAYRIRAGSGGGMGCVSTWIRPGQVMNVRPRPRMSSKSFGRGGGGLVEIDGLGNELNALKEFERSQPPVKRRTDAGAGVG